MAAPAFVTDSFDANTHYAIEITLARLKTLDPEKYAALKLIAEDAVRRAWTAALARERSDPPTSL